MFYLKLFVNLIQLFLPYIYIDVNTFRNNRQNDITNDNINKIPILTNVNICYFHVSFITFFKSTAAIRFFYSNFL